MDDLRDGRQLYCIITDENGSSVQSETVTMTMLRPEITKQPEDVKVKDGEEASTTVVAEGEDLSYQWYFTSNGESSTFKTSSMTGETYTTTMDESKAGRQVYCVITDAYGNKVQSDTVTLNMEQSAAAELKITQQPVSVTVKNGETASATVVAEGEGLSYQWYYTSNGSNDTFYASSNKTATYSTQMNTSRAGRQVYCVITDAYGNKVTSDTVTLNMA